MTTEQQPLDAETCRRARLARDSRFDGEFFLAVRTTGIYCRPVCPARSPAEKNVSYYRLASQAAAAGYRPCLRCRPESAPGSPAWRGSATTVQRALGLIREGALIEGDLEQLAARLGVGERYLRKLFQRELGVSPQAVALNQRLLFAKKLLAETDMPLTEVAFAAGFGSVRRFNSAVREQFQLTPGQLRGRRRGRESTGAISLQLHYRPPYDWDGVIDFFSRHALEGVEEASADSYRRRVRLGAEDVTVTISPTKGRDALTLDVSGAEQRHLLPLVARIRRMFDLDANPAVIGQALGQDPHLASLWRRTPGIRSPGYWSLFEAAVRAIVGQQVSTVAARSICARLARDCADGESLLFPTAARLAVLPDSAFPMPGRRRNTLQSLCLAFRERETELDLDALGDLRGVGPWTVAMVAMRGAGHPDQLPASDLGLVKAWRALGATTDLHQQSANWRPWRAYAANLLWRSLSQ